MVTILVPYISPPLSTTGVISMNQANDWIVYRFYNASTRGKLVIKKHLVTMIVIMRRLSIKAGKGIRTLDIHVGNVTLYH